MFIRRKQGFTLIELVLTIIVVGIISIPLSILISQYIESVFVSEDYNIALHLARLEMETVNNLSYNSIASASYSKYYGYNYDVVRKVSYAAGNATSTESMKQVEVQVLKPGTAIALANLKTYITKNLSYGI
jgi:prepilin-type N-terminal cleavage/methylation domain-containing protein